MSKNENSCNRLCRCIRVVILKLFENCTKEIKSYHEQHHIENDIKLHANSLQCCISVNISTCLSIRRCVCVRAVTGWNDCEHIRFSYLCSGFCSCFIKSRPLQRSSCCRLHCFADSKSVLVVYQVASSSAFISFWTVNDCNISFAFAVVLMA